MARFYLHADRGGPPESALLGTLECPPDRLWDAAEEALWETFA